MKHTLLTFLLCSFFGPAVCQENRPYLNEALKVEKWLQSVKVKTPEGTYWPSIPEEADGTVIQTDLYSGSAGVVLFYLELYNTTKISTYLKEALDGTKFLIAHGSNAKTYDEVGLYTGLAGVLWTVSEVQKISQYDELKESTQILFQNLKRKAKPTKVGVSWRYTDIVYGSAGIGLTLLDLKEIPGAKELAIATGKELVRAATPDAKGLKWYMDTAMVKQNYYMPNFSHGTAGVSYFLLKLYKETKNKEFLNAALKGVSHLESLENKNNWIFHHNKEDGKNLYYLSWCHGPAGTARLYYEMYLHTKDARWLTKMEKASKAIMQCGIPQKELPGYWNNVGACCGSASIAEFFLDMHKVTKKPEYLEFSLMVTDDLMARSTIEGKGIKWIQAEHRKTPQLLEAQTGLMQGAAGIGIWLLKLDAFKEKESPAIQLPDNPF